MKSVAIGIAVLLIGWVAIRMVAARATPPTPLGLQDGRLPPCPGTRNCADSLDPDRTPISYTGSREDALSRLVDLLDVLLETELGRVEPDYVHALTRSRVFGFIDDLEFHLPEGENVIHYRSAARSGRSDFGVNRQRMDRLIAAFEEIPDGDR